MNGIADYEFVRSLGRGNHGEFFVATTPLRLPVQAEYVAIKVLSGPTSEDVFRRATRELSAFAAVRSPHLVTLYDAGQQGSSFYYAMEYLAEGSLGRPADESSRRPADESSRRPAEGTPGLGRAQVITAVADAARAAHALHEAGIVHRDIKPGNVLLSRGRGKLADLGLSQVISPGVTVTGMGSVGAIEFTDPALVQGAKPSRATDIFSLGATLHRALAGVGFYGDLPDDDAMLALRRVLSQPPTISSTLDPAVATAISWAIAPNAFDRPATALVLAEYLDSLA